MTSIEDKISKNAEEIKRKRGEEERKKEEKRLLWSKRRELLEGLIRERLGRVQTGLDELGLPQIFEELKLFHDRERVPRFMTFPGDWNKSSSTDYEKAGIEQEFRVRLKTPGNPSGFEITVKIPGKEPFDCSFPYGDQAKKELWGDETDFDIQRMTVVMDKYTSSFHFEMIGPYYKSLDRDGGGRTLYRIEYAVAVSRVGENDWQVSFNGEVLGSLEQVDRDFLEEIVARQYAKDTT